MEIRRIRPGDEDALRSLRIAALLDSPTSFAMTAAEEEAAPASKWVDLVAASASGDAAALFVAQSDGVLVGMAGTFSESPGRIQIWGMWTHPGARGKGVGRALLDACIGWARSARIREIVLWVTETNASAAALYTSAGFEPTGVRQPLPSEPRLHEYEMRLAP